MHTLCPIWFRQSAAASPAGPDPTTATFIPVRCDGIRGTTHPSSQAFEMIEYSILLIVTGESTSPATHAPSHGAGQTRPVNSGKLFVFGRKVRVGNFPVDDYAGGNEILRGESRGGVFLVCQGSGNIFKQHAAKIWNYPNEYQRSRFPLSMDTLNYSRKGRTSPTMTHILSSGFLGLQDNFVLHEHIPF